jgi:polyferredoxin
MKITTSRKISQIFFLSLFLWFCVTSSLGDRWNQLRGWPVNWIIELDPLVGIATLLTTKTLYAELLWGLAVILLTLLLGRFFCGWLCPFGTIHQFTGFLAKYKKPFSEKSRLNQPSAWQAMKYYLLIFFLAAAAIEAASFISQDNPLLRGSLQIGLLDPIPLLYRSVNLVLLAIFDDVLVPISASRRYYDGAWVIGLIFFTAIFLNFIRPRFFCRFICPLGALLGIISRYAIFRVGKRSAECIDCTICEKNCEGACSPASKIRFNECVLCMNCLKDCKHDLMTYRVYPSEAGEKSLPDLTRRGIVISLAAGALSPPAFGLSGLTSTNRFAGLVRPPGSLAEAEFLKRCIKCGQCMRVCPTNVIQPAGLQTGFEALWTPTLNFRIGTSGCQHNCIACGNICPTAAIRPLTLEERMGKGEFAQKGPIKIGMAFVDRGRCLPWAMGRPCIVCQENCPVSPKAIYTTKIYQPVRGYEGVRLKKIRPDVFTLTDSSMTPERFATGDYFLKLHESRNPGPRLIRKNGEKKIHLAEPLQNDAEPAEQSPADIAILLQLPHVDPEKCIGCGVCQHECPVKLKRAIRVTADRVFLL